MRVFIILSIILLTQNPIWSHNDHGVPGPSSQTFLFEENKGQMPDNVRFRAAMGSKYLYVENDQLTWHLKHEGDLMSLPNSKHQHVIDSSEHILRQHVFRVQFKNGSPKNKFVGVDSSYSVKHYMRGRNKSNWASYVHSFKQIQNLNVYPNIDFHFYLHESSLKYDFVVHPGGNPFDIQMQYKDVDTLFLKDEMLYIVTSVDTLIEKAPVAYQEILGKKKAISCKFILKDNIVSFYVSDAYNPNYKLTIDPELVFSTYTGSEISNWGMTATPGLNDEMFTGGIAFGPGYPTTSGAYDQRFNQGTSPQECDVVISKFSPDGSRLEYSTYLGGSSSEVPHSIIVNNLGQLVIYGTTGSDDFPTNAFAYQPSFQGGRFGLQANGIPFTFGSDIFVAVLSADGSSLEGSTYMGGDRNDGINNLNDLPYNYGDQFRGEVIVDAQNNIYIASFSQSSDFPTSPSAFSDQLDGAQDAVVFGLNENCTALRFSSYLGGSGNDAAYSLKLAANGDILVGGGTTSQDFPTTASTIAPNYQGGPSDGFVTRLNPQASLIRASTYIGTNDRDQVYLLTNDFEENVYIAGQSTGRMPISSGVYSNANSGQYLQILDPQLTTVQTSTTFGTGSGEVDISLTALMVDTCQRVFLSGWGGMVNNTYRDQNGYTDESTTSGLPITADAFQSTTTGSDFYFIVFEKEFSRLLYATFFGRSETIGDFSGDHVDGGTSRFSDKGIIYQAVCAGCGGFSDFPTTPGAWSRTNNALPNNESFGQCNLAAIKFDFQISTLEADVDLRLDTFGCAPYNAEFINLSIGADEYFWDFGDGTTSTAVNPNHLYDSIGQYDVLFVAISNSSCLDPDTLELTIDIILAEPPNKNDLLVCGEPSATLSSARETPGASYRWNTGSTDRSIEVFSSGIYSVTATESNCVFVDSFDLTLVNPNTRLEDTTLCGADEYTLQLDSRATNIVWSSNVNGSGPSVTVDQNDIYTVTYDINSCTFRDTAAIEFPSIPVIEIFGRDTACAGEIVTLSIENKSAANIDEFQWSTGERTASIQVAQTGTYSVTVVSDSSCTYVAEKFVYIIPELPPIDVPDTLLCKDSEFEVDLSLYDTLAEIVWNDGSTEAIRTFTTNGSYSFTISTACQTIRDNFTVEFSQFASNEQPFYIPNTFTPNRDEINDIFRLEPADEMQILNYQMDVFDRWGNRLYTTQNPDAGWDGSFKDVHMDLGIYTYVIELDYFVCEEPQHVKVSGDIAIGDR